MKALVRTAAIATALSVVFTGVIGFAHTPMGRPLLKYLPLPGASMCPVLGHEPDPAALEAQRQKTTSALKGNARATSQQVLGFELSKTTRDEVKQWAALNQVRCESQLHDAALDCTQVPGTAANAFPVGLDALYLRFDPHGALVAVDAQARRPVDQAVGGFASYAGTLASELGRPHRTLGEGSVLALAKGPYQRGAIEYRFSDMAVDLSVTSLPTPGGNDGLLRAQFRAITE